MIFNSLDSEHKDLVRQGKIVRGMSKPAVFLAMGHPDSKTSGVQHGKSFDRWHYNILIPVYSHYYAPYYRYGYGPYGCRGGYYGLGYQTSVHYVPLQGSTVEFNKGKVTDWSVVNGRFQ